MSGMEKTMTEIRNIIHHLRLGYSKRKIHKKLGVYRPLIRELYKLAIEHQWLDPKIAMPSDENIAKARSHLTKIEPKHRLNPYHEEIKQWDEKEKSSVVIKQLLQDEKLFCDVQVIRRYRNKHFPIPIEPVMVRSTVPGDDLELDFGELGRFLNDDGEIVRVWLFSLRLRHSRRAYREIVTNQKIPTFLMGHVHAFEYFNGVPKNCILDNLKAGVTKSSIDNDALNRSYQELAEYYGCVLAPCLPRKPQHKGGVEGDVKYVKHNFLPYFLEKQRQIGIDTPTITDLIEALRKWDQEVADIRLIHGVGRSPAELFASEEQKALRPLPKTRFEPSTWSVCIVRREWRIMVECAYYSVPYRLIGEKVDVRVTHAFVRIYHNHQEVALHERAKKKWEYKRNADHAPPFKEAVLQCSREGLLTLAQEIGQFTHQVAKTILDHPSVDKLRPVRHLLKLAEKYSKEKLEKACQRAFICKICSYKNVKNILEVGLDTQLVIPAGVSKTVPITSGRFARNPKDYKSHTYNSRSETFEEKIDRLHPFSTSGNAMGGAFSSMAADSLFADPDFVEEITRIFEKSREDEK